MSPELLEIVAGAPDLASLDPAERRLAMRSLLKHAVSEDALGGSVSSLSDWIDGFGPLSEAVADPQVTDVFVNATDDVWIERQGSLQRSGVRFADEGELLDLIERLTGAVGIRVDASHPIADGRLRDGSRIHVVLPPVSGAGPLLSIRCFPEEALDLDDLIASSFLTELQASRLSEAVTDRRNILISGATGAGKTTLANALLGRVPPTERLVLIEETPELRPACAHWVSLLTRETNVEGTGDVDQLTLLRAALRMRPDRIVVGEVRGAEAFAALQALSTGHEGSLLTVHARCASDACERLVELARLDPHATKEETVRRQTERIFDLVVHVEKQRGTRRVAEILERSADG